MKRMREITMDKNTIRETVRMIASDQSVISIVGVTVSRKDTLENLAKNISYKVKRSKRSVSLEPMNPYERRIIHSALQNDKYVTTHSEGEEPFRRVVISLKR